MNIITALWNEFDFKFNTILRIYIYVFKSKEFGFHSFRFKQQQQKCFSLELLKHYWHSIKSTKKYLHFKRMNNFQTLREFEGCFIICQNDGLHRKILHLKMVNKNIVIKLSTIGSDILWCIERKSSSHTPLSTTILRSDLVWLSPSMLSYWRHYFAAYK